MGDILVNDSHAIVVVSGAALSGENAAAVSRDVDVLARAVITGRYGNGDARRAALGDKYVALQARVSELLSGTANAVCTSTSVARVIAETYKVVCDSLNVRSAPNLRVSVVAGHSRGERIYSIADDTVAADGYVWAHYAAYSGATRYMAMGTADGSEKKKYSEKA